MRIQSIATAIPTYSASPALSASAPKASEAAQAASDVVEIAPTQEVAPKPQHTAMKNIGLAFAAGGALVALPSLASAATGTAMAAAPAAKAAAPAAAAAAPAAFNLGSFLGSAQGLLSVGVSVAIIASTGIMAYNLYKQHQANHAPTHTEQSGKTGINFDNVAGVPEAKAELMEVVDFLKNPEKYAKMGAKAPHGVLLSGPPGTGKTLLAKAVAGEAGSNFISMAGSDFIEKYVGVGAERVRDLFNQAREKKPCVIFIDEIDAIGGQRAGSGEPGSQEHDQTLNALLKEMDGFDSGEGVVVLAATNRQDMLDNALTRSGRFDRKVVVDRPNRDGRLAILKVHAKGKPMEDGLDLGLIADRTTGLVGADMANIMNEGAINAIRRGANKISLADLSQAIDKVVMGPQRSSRVLSPVEKETTAYHEAGHAIVSKALPSNGILQKVSILPRGQACGVTWTVPRDDHNMMRTSELLDRICMLMGGRAGEDRRFNGIITTGASNDIERATEIAKGMVTDYGMTDLGQVTLRDPRSRDQGLVPSQETQRQIDLKVKEIIDGQWQRAKSILAENDGKWNALSESLMKNEELDKPELDKILGPDVDSAPAPAPQPSQPKAA